MENAPSQLDSAPAGSWLCRDDRDRERMLDMEERVRPVRRRAIAIMALALAAAGPWIGWLPVLLIIPLSAIFAAADRLIATARRPENLMFATWVGAEVTLAAALAVAGDAGASALSLLAVPILTLTSRFSMRGVLAGVAVALALTLTAAFGFQSQAVLAAPVILIAPVAVILCVAVLSAPLMRSDIEHRYDALVDPLTGMLNRKALEVRVHELTLQSQITREPIGLIVADLDHFKTINDTGGHHAGDRALKAVSGLIRAQLRAFDLAYRLGGEEFLILVPGSDLQPDGDPRRKGARRCLRPSARRRRAHHHEPRRDRVRRRALLRLRRPLRRGGRGPLQGQARGAQPRLHQR